MRRARRHLWLAYALALGACQSDSRDAARSSVSPPDASHPPVPSTETAAPIRGDTTSDNSRPAPDSQWRITAGHFGPITVETGEADLRRLFGNASVKSDSIHLGEGEFWPGTVLYPGDSLRAVEITWRDTVQRRRPWRVEIRGRKSLWHVEGRIRLGTTLQELERLNRKPFTMSGYGWDYGGRVVDWNGGALDTMLRRNDYRLGFALFPDSAGRETKDEGKISGDRPYSSSLPALQRLNPAVWDIFLDFPENSPP